MKHCSEVVSYGMDNNTHYSVRTDISILNTLKNAKFILSEAELSQHNSNKIVYSFENLKPS